MNYAIYCPICKHKIAETSDDPSPYFLFCACGKTIMVQDQREYQPQVFVCERVGTPEPETRANRIDRMTDEIMRILDAAPDYEFAPVEEVFDELVSDGDVLRLHSLGISNL